MQLNKIHYAIRYKKRICFLEDMVRKYYLANYRAKKLAGIDPGICGISTLGGNEEHMVFNDKETLKEIINDLPLLDCGC